MKRILVMTKFALDSNILVYLVGPDEVKAATADALLRQEHTISVQVLNEFVRVARQKLKIEWPMVEEVVESAREYCDVKPITLDTQARAVELCRDHKINIFDANIIAVAEFADCDVLYSEDMSHGQRIGAVTVRNPFVKTP
jgi:predicted nucleic acid-binding protein